MIATSYEVEEARLESPNAIEIVHANQKDQDIEDLIFTQTNEGYTVDQNSLEEPANATVRARESLCSTSDQPGDDNRIRASGYSEAQQNPEYEDDARISDAVLADGGEIA